jgi:hypothetical protein
VITGLPTPGSAVVSVALEVAVAVAVAALLDDEVVVWLAAVRDGDEETVVLELPQPAQAAATSTAAARRATVVAEPGRCIDRRPGRS